MPLPMPGKSEDEKTFVSRCMGNDTALSDFPDEKQRAAVCYSQWRKAHPAASSSFVTARAPERRLGMFTIAQEGDVEIRDEHRAGRDWKVVPVIALVQGVFQAANSPGPELFLATEFAKRDGAEWNGRPVTLGHPRRDDGALVSAGSSPDLFDAYVIGQVFGAHVEDDKLKAELWLDLSLVTANEQAAASVAKLEAGEHLDVSHSAWYDVIPQRGVYAGQRYDDVLRNVQPDHIALLPAGVAGMCAWQHGCGTPRVAVGVAAVEPCCDNCAGFDYGAALIEAARASGHRNHLQLVETALRAKLDSPWAEALEVFDDTVVYADESGLVSRSYKVRDGKVTFGDEVISVRPVVDFAPVVVGQTEDETMTDEKKTATPAVETETAPVSQQPVLAATADDLLKYAEPALAAFVRDQMALGAQERKRLEEAILSAEGNAWTADELAEIPAGHLVKMAGLIKPAAEDPLKAAAATEYAARNSAPTTTVADPLAGFSMPAWASTAGQEQ